VVWSILQAILLLSALIPQGHLICDGGWGNPGVDGPELVSIDDGTWFSPGREDLSPGGADPLSSGFVERMDLTTFACVDGIPRLFPVGLNATLTRRAGDCTDLALLRVEILRRNGIPARPVHGVMVWDAETFQTDALHVEVFGRGIAIHDWVELDDGRTIGAYEGIPGIRCVKTGNGVCLQPVFEALGYI